MATPSFAGGSSGSLYKNKIFMINAILQFFVDVYNQLIQTSNPFEVFIVVFFNGGWVIVLIIFLISGKVAWHNWRQIVYHIRKRKFILLAIDVPRDNEQSPKAVENIFTHLHGALPGSNNLYEEWWLGKTPDYFSVEIISIEGYVQFIVYCQEEYRDLVESAFYAQYPDAEITQVEDYVYGLNNEFKDLRFPNNKYELYGCEFVLAKNNAYPIRLHIDFEHSLSQEFKDPMAALLESLNKIGPGEQFWFQLVITPEYNQNWQPQADALAMGIAGKKVNAPSGHADKAIGEIVKWLDAFGNVVFPFYNSGEEEQKKDDMPSLMLHLTPTEHKQIEGIQMKADKFGFWCKFRYIYIADKKIASKARGLSPIVGAIKQYASLNLNTLRVHKYTKTWGLDYLRVPERISRRQNNLIRAFQSRARTDGSSGMILNTEELATLYHFPTEVVKAPLVSRTLSKRSSAPISLPVDGHTEIIPKSNSSTQTNKQNEPAPGIEKQQKPDQPPITIQENQAKNLPNNLPFME